MRRYNNCYSSRWTIDKGMRWASETSSLASGEFLSSNAKRRLYGQIVCTFPGVPRSVTVVQMDAWLLDCPQSYANIVSVCLDVRLAVGTCNTSNNECLDAVKGMKLCSTMPWPSSYDPVYGQDMTCIWIKAYCSSRRKKQRLLLPLVAECGGNFLLCCLYATWTKWTDSKYQWKMSCGRLVSDNGV